VAKDVSKEILIDFLNLVLLLASVLAIDAGLKHAEAYFALSADLMYWLHKVTMWTAIMSIALFCLTWCAILAVLRLQKLRKMVRDANKVSIHD
jgi:hypothetical protein